MRPIDADELMRKYCGTCSIADDMFCLNCKYHEFRVGIKEAPTIEAEPVRHAHWVFRDEDKHLLEDGCIPSNMRCSYCNQWSDNDSYGDAYCHNCGARMDEPDLADKIAKEESK